IHAKEQQPAPSGSVSTNSLVHDSEDSNLAKGVSGGRLQSSGEIILDEPAPSDENNPTRQRNKLVSRINIFAH
ncbi:MAG: hypothetical protein VW862_09120, partial [Euryarchaeota archaeon]